MYKKIYTKYILEVNHFYIYLKSNLKHNIKMQPNKQSLVTSRNLTIMASCHREHVPNTFRQWNYGTQSIHREDLSHVRNRCWYVYSSRITVIVSPVQVDEVDEAVTIVREPNQLRAAFSQFVHCEKTHGKNAANFVNCPNI